MRDVAPRVPASLHPLAREILNELRARPAAKEIVLGGGVALQHYCEFRSTVDLDAWWAKDARPETEALINEVMTTVAARHRLEVDVRQWRETQSYELKENNKKRFSFQIALRSVQLEPASDSEWAPVKLESFRDNLAAKMTALVDRGAPRDFLDVREVCYRDLAEVDECWQAWAQKNPASNAMDARLRVLHHLEQLESRRPLEIISSAEERERAREVRSWMRTSLCRETER